jgi:hypothetical protein
MKKKLSTIVLFLIIFLPVFSFGQGIIRRFFSSRKPDDSSRGIVVRVQQTTPPKPYIDQKIKKQLSASFNNKDVRMNLNVLPGRKRILPGKKTSSCQVITGDITIGGKKFKMNCASGSEFKIAMDALLNKRFWNPKNGTLGIAFYDSLILRPIIMDLATKGYATHSFFIFKDNQTEKFKTLEAREVTAVIDDETGKPISGVAEFDILGVLRRLHGDKDKKFMDAQFLQFWIREPVKPLDVEQSRLLNNFVDEISGKKFDIIKTLEEPIGRQYVFINDQDKVNEIMQICSRYFCAQSVYQALLRNKNLITPARLSDLRPRTAGTKIGSRLILPRPEKSDPNDVLVDNIFLTPDKWTKA